MQRIFRNKIRYGKILLEDLSNNAGTYGSAALTDSETQTFFHSDRGDQLNGHVNVITRHTHLCAFRQVDNTGNVSGSEIELGTIVVEERSMTAAFVLGQYVYMTLELGVRMNGAGLSNNRLRYHQPQHSPESF